MLMANAGSAAVMMTDANMAAKMPPPNYAPKL